MTYPILHLEIYGAVTESTAWDGVRLLFRRGDIAIGVIVFLASIVIPLLKLTGLFYLVITSYFRSAWLQSTRNCMLGFIESMGRWAMLDVFVVAVLVSAVKLQSLATIHAGVGALPFAGVVVCTLIASASFDPRLIWQEGQRE